MKKLFKITIEEGRLSVIKNLWIIEENVELAINLVRSNYPLFLSDHILSIATIASTDSEIENMLLTNV